MNTLGKGKFRILIYRQKDVFVGICYETGHVVSGDTAEEVLKTLDNGFIATLKAIKAGHLTEAAINHRPSLKYRIIFHCLPMAFSFAKWLEVSFFTKPISPGGLVHAGF